MSHVPGLVEETSTTARRKSLEVIDGSARIVRDDAFTALTNGTPHENCVEPSSFFAGRKLGDSSNWCAKSRLLKTRVVSGVSHSTRSKRQVR